MNQATPQRISTSDAEKLQQQLEAIGENKSQAISAVFIPEPGKIVATIQEDASAKRWVWSGDKVDDYRGSDDSLSPVVRAASDWDVLGITSLADQECTHPSFTAQALASNHTYVSVGCSEDFQGGYFDAQPLPTIADLSHETLQQVLNIIFQSVDPAALTSMMVNGKKAASGGLGVSAHADASKLPDGADCYAALSISVKDNKTKMSPPQCLEAPIKEYQTPFGPYQVTPDNVAAAITAIATHAKAPAENFMYFEIYVDPETNQPVVQAMTGDFRSYTADLSGKILQDSRTKK